MGRGGGSAEAGYPGGSGCSRGAVPSQGAGEGRNDGETPGKTSSDVLRLLRDQPGLSAPQLADRRGKSRSAIERAVKKLREAGLLVRMGPDKGGSWRVIE